MHPIPNKRDNFIWFLCNRIINIIHCLRHSTTTPHFYEKVFPRLDQLHKLLKSSKPGTPSGKELILYKLMLDYYTLKLQMQNDAESLKAYQDVLVRTSLIFYKKTVGSDLELAKMFLELRVIEKEWMEILYPSNVLGNDLAMPLSSS